MTKPSVSPQTRRNRYGFGIGTIGRDALYTMVSMYLLFYLTDVIKIPTSLLGGVTVIMIITRVFDAVNDPFMGIVVDNTHSRFGKFKPWIVAGGLVTSVFTVLMFTDWHLTGGAFLVVFLLTYILWEISFTANDIGYWGMLPALSQDQQERERIGGFARICANIGLFAMVVGIVPITNWLTRFTSGSLSGAYQLLAICVVIVMLFFLTISLSLTREGRFSTQEQGRTSLKGMVQVIFKNDQLLWITISLTLFMVGYVTTTSFGIYYFKYVYGNETMYSVFALVLGISQILSLSLFPLVSRHFSRQKMYRVTTGMVVLGYVIFFFAPTTTMLFIGLAGVLIFVGQAAIQLLMLMFITDTVEYGEWLFHQRNESITLSLQAFINKLGGAIANGVVGFTLILSGMKEAGSAARMTAQGVWIFKSFMMILPLLCILAGYLVYRRHYKIDAQFYQKIVQDLAKRREQKP